MIEELQRQYNDLQQTNNIMKSQRMRMPGEDMYQHPYNQD